MAVIYRPKHQRQIVASDPYGSKNCTAVSAAIAFDRATLGGCEINGRQVRAMSDEPIPDPASPGLNIHQIVEVADKLHIELTNWSGHGWDDVIKCLRAGRGVVLQGDYDQMGSYSCQSSFLGNHAIFVNNVNTPGDKGLAYDPLCPAYRYMPLSVLRRYAEKLNPHCLFAITRVTPNIPAQIN